MKRILFSIGLFLAPLCAEEKGPVAVQQKNEVGSLDAKEMLVQQAEVQKKYDRLMKDHALLQSRFDVLEQKNADLEELKVQLMRFYDEVSAKNGKLVDDLNDIIIKTAEAFQKQYPTSKVKLTPFATAVKNIFIEVAGSDADISLLPIKKKKISGK